MKHILVGSILWVSWGEVLKTTLLYGLVAIVLWRIHGRLSLVSRDAEADLRAVLAFEGRQEDVPDNAPWLALFEEARRLRDGGSN